MNKKRSKIDIVTGIAVISLVLNLILSVSKLITGLIMNQLSIVSDGIHGFSDIFTTIIALISVVIARRKADKTHNFGYKGFGSIASLALGVILIVVSVTIFTHAIEELIECDYSRDNPVAIDPIFILSLIILSVSIVAKETMFHLTRYAARKEKSDALRADAWHQRVDALSSLGAIAGLIASHFGIHFIDPIISMLIIIMIVHIAIEVGSKAIDQLSGKSLPKESLVKIKNLIKDCLPVANIRSVSIGPTYIVVIEISKDSLTLTIDQYLCESDRLKILISKIDSNIEDTIFELKS